MAATVLAGCSAPDNALTRLGMPEPITDRAQHTLQLWQGFWITAFIIGALVWGLIIGMVVKYRHREGRVAQQIRYHLPVEILYSFVPFVIVGVLFFYTVQTQDAVLETDRGGPPQHEVHVVGSQWQWTFNYVNEDSVEETVYDAGTTEHLPELWLVQNETVRLDLTSPDVAHSFWVPDFLFKLDVLPGHPNSFEITPTKLGTYKGRCAEMCGLFHSRMLFTLKVVTPTEFEAHLSQLEEAGQTGEADGPDIPQPVPSGSEEAS